MISLFMHFCNMKRGDGCFTQLKHVAFLITFVKCCVWTDCFYSYIVVLFIDTTLSMLLTV